jgi:hypothetical protein
MNEYQLFGAERYEDGILTRLVLTTRDGGTSAITMEGESSGDSDALPRALIVAHGDFCDLEKQRFAALNP